MHVATSAIIADAACMRGCSRGRHHKSSDLHIGANSGVENIRDIGHGHKAEFGQLLPQHALLTMPNNLECLYTKIRFATPTLSALLSLAGPLYLS
jgi:hypothetical protein